MVEAVLAAEHHEDSDEDHHVAHVGLPVVHSSPLFTALDREHAQHESRIDHFCNK